MPLGHGIFPRTEVTTYACFDRYVLHALVVGPPNHMKLFRLSRCLHMTRGEG